MASHEPERRAAPRAATSRDALFYGLEDEGLPRQGRAVDLSRDGLQIHTDQPEAVGALLEVELRPKPLDPEQPAVFIEAHVVRVDSLPNGASAMGLRRHGKHRSPVAIPVRGTASENLMTVELKPRAAAPKPRHLDVSIGDEGMDVTFKRIAAAEKPVRRRGKGKRWAALLILLLLLLLLALGTGLTSSLFSFRLDPRRTAERVPEIPTEATSGGASVEAGDYGGTSPEALVLQAHAAMAGGRTPEALAAFKALQEHPRATPVEHFLGALGRAEALGVQRKTSQALVQLQSALGMGGQVPEVWLDAARALRVRLFQASGKELEPEVFVQVLDLQSQPKNDQKESKLRLRVDKAKYTLTILRGEQVLGVFLVGLGCDDTTPSGSYTVVNKLTNPDWYNRGTVVKAGDPANQIGKRYMVLGKDGRPTPYGFHPTEDTDSIGKPMSRGCVRMHAEDAESVFRLVPLGTSVEIGTWD